MKFDKDMLIGDLLAQAPEKADILLAEACEVHGIDVDEILKELNKDA